MKKRRRNHKWRRLRNQGDDPGVTRAYTPQDETALIAETYNTAGILRSNSRGPKLKTNLENLGESGQTANPDRVVVVIVLLSLIFIAIMTYYVAQMPPK